MIFTNVRPDEIIVFGLRVKEPLHTKSNVLKGGSFHKKGLPLLGLVHDPLGERDEHIVPYVPAAAVERPVSLES